MKSILLILLLFSLNTYGLNSPLYPEDGSLPINKWFYSSSRVKPQTLNKIESAMRREGIEPIVFDKYEWMQDILFFNQSGQFVELANIPASDEYFPDVTMGVFESYGSFGELTKITAEEFSQFTSDQDYLVHTFLEGGATITGKLENGEDYIIFYEERFNAFSKFFRRGENINSTRVEIMNVIAKDLSIKVENLILLDSKSGSEHLDLYIKALPGGVLLIDDPESRVDWVRKALPKDSIVLKNIEAYELGENYSWRKNNYKKKIKHVTKQLKNKFKVIPVVGRYFEYYTNVNGVTTAQEKINFFNGISGINPDGKQFYITNRSLKASDLEEDWRRILGNFGFDKKNIHFPGEYSNGAGLDCMGSPSL
jgi:hypothetical protein